MFIGFIWHQAGQASLAQLLFEPLAYPCIFVGVFDLVVGKVAHALIGIAVELCRRVKGKVPRVGAAYVEVLVKPPVGWDEDAGFLPGVRCCASFAWLRANPSTA